MCATATTHFATCLSKVLKNLLKLLSLILNFKFQAFPKLLAANISNTTISPYPSLPNVDRDHGQSPLLFLAAKVYTQIVPLTINIT